MGDHSHIDKRTEVHSTDTTSPGGRAAASEGNSGMMACGMGNKGLKGLCLTAASCAAPLLLLLALPVLGADLGGRTTPIINAFAVLACPVGMALMMWMMRGQRAGPQSSIQAQPVSVSTVASTGPPTPAVNGQ